MFAKVAHAQEKIVWMGRLCKDPIAVRHSR